MINSENVLTDEVTISKQMYIQDIKQMEEDFYQQGYEDGYKKGGEDAIAACNR